METFIDGYNLLMKIGRLADLVRAGELERSRETLLSFLARAKRAELRRATVIFDAGRLKRATLAGPEGLSLRRERRGELAVIFSPPGVEADAVIKQLLDDRAERPGGERPLVVTSDRQVASYARRAGARVETSEVCAHDLAGHQRPRHGRPPPVESAEPEKELCGPDEGEADLWLRYFGMQGEGDKPVEI